MKLKNLVYVLLTLFIVSGCNKVDSVPLTTIQTSNVTQVNDNILNPDSSFIDFLLTSNIGHKSIEEIGPVIYGKLTLDHSIEDIYQLSKDDLINNGISLNANHLENEIINSNSFDEFIQSNFKDYIVSSKNQASFFGLYTDGSDENSTSYSTDVTLFNNDDYDKTYYEIFKSKDYITTISSSRHLGFDQLDDKDTQLSVLKKITSLLGLPDKIVFNHEDSSIAKSVSDGLSFSSSCKLQNEFENNSITYLLLYEFDNYTLTLNLLEQIANDQIENTIKNVGGISQNPNEYRFNHFSTSNFNYLDNVSTEIVGKLNDIEILYKSN